MRSVAQSVVPVIAWALLGCPGCAAPEPDHLSNKIDGLNTSLEQDIAELNGELLACMRRENDLLRAKRDALDAQIAAARIEAAAIASAQPKNSKGSR